MKVLRENVPLPDAQDNERFTMDMENGFCVSVMSYGATLLTVHAADRQGVSENVVCCFENLADYTSAGGYLGASVGPVAGRIAHARFTLDGQEYHTDPNENGNTLHSGSGGISHRLWQAEEPICEQECITLRMYIDLPDGDGGFPGNRRITAEFLVEAHALTIRYITQSDAPTPANLTNHAYFDLSARFDGSALEQLVTIPAERVLVNGATNLPEQFLSVEKQPYDLRKPIRIRDAALRSGDKERLSRQRGFDNAFDLAGTSSPQVTLLDLDSGRKMTVETKQHAVVHYAGGFMSDLPTLHKGKIPVQGSGVCFETQDYPNAYALGLPIQTATPDAPCIQETKFTFTNT